MQRKNQWVEDFTHFWNNKIYVIVLALTAACSYGYMILNYAVGIDDTPYAYYFEEGLAAIVGRWVCFLLNQVIDIAEFAPYFTDLVGVLIFMVAVTVWATLLYRILGGRIPLYGYLFFACIFLSSPLISEVYVYYLHNAVATGYLCSGVSLCFFLEGLDTSARKGTGKRTFVVFSGSAVFLWIALGCYESFMMVWLMGVCLILMLRRICNRKDGVFTAVGIAGAVAACSIVFRSITIASITSIYDLEYLRDDAAQRSITELIGWIVEPDALGNFFMALKRTYLMYGVFACAYYPIFVFVMGSTVILITVAWMSIRKRDVWILLLTVAAYVAAFSLIVVEGKATYYRAAQFLPILCGLGALLLVYGSVNLRIAKLSKTVQGAVLVILSAVLWNQCMNMNQWYYLDHKKYEVAKETMYQVVYELEKGYDTQKPIVFTGIYEIPASITKPAYVEYGTEEFFFLCRMTHWLDEHLLEKFYREEGVIVAQMPTLSLIEWGRTAFGTDEELVHFFKMHGYDYLPLVGVDYEEADAMSWNLPSFPQMGSIVDAGEYTIVHF